MEEIGHEERRDEEMMLLREKVTSLEKENPDLNNTIRQMEAKTTPKLERSSLLLSDVP